MCVYGMSLNINGIYYAHVCEQARWARSAGNSAIVNLFLLLLSFMCYCANTGVEWILKQESAQKVGPGEEHFPALQGLEPATFQSRVRCSNHWAIPTPMLMRKVDLIFLLCTGKARKHIATIGCLGTWVYDNTVTSITVSTIKKVFDMFPGQQECCPSRRRQKYESLIAAHPSVPTLKPPVPLVVVSLSCVYSPTHQTRQHMRFEFYVKEYSLRHTYYTSFSCQHSSKHWTGKQHSSIQNSLVVYLFTSFFIVSHSLAVV